MKSFPAKFKPDISNSNQQYPYIHLYQMGIQIQNHELRDSIPDLPFQAPNSEVCYEHWSITSSLYCKEQFSQINPGKNYGWWSQRNGQKSHIKIYKVLSHHFKKSGFLCISKYPVLTNYIIVTKYYSEVCPRKNMFLTFLSPV
jgi:hypothetical protein